MSMKAYPVIDPVATGNNIRRLRMERGLTVRDLQSYFGFEEPRAIYKWQKGESLPTADNLYALGYLFEIPMDQILIPTTVKLHIVGEQQAEYCCSSLFFTRLFWMRQGFDAASTICPACVAGGVICFAASDACGKEYPFAVLFVSSSASVDCFWRKPSG